MSCNIEKKAGNSRYAYYRKITSNYGVKRLPALYQILPNDKNSKFTLLEMGCGAGHISAAISQHYPNARIIATDLIQNCLDVVKKNYPQLECKQVDAEGHFPFKDSSIDFIVSSNLYEHLRNEKRHLHEVNRVLRREGIYFISTPNYFFDILWWTFHTKQGKALDVFWGRLIHDPKQSHCNLQTIRSLKKTLQAYGFSPETLKREHFSNTEQNKLESLLKWLPIHKRLNTLRLLEKIWLKIPPRFHFTIAMKAKKI